jgi:ethanolamine-phosphate cytidylyltransferase
MYLNLPIFNVKRVVYVNGVFDMFHIAHMRLLNEAKKNGTYIIVGVHTDEDVVVYKPKSPILTFKERCDAIKKSGLADKVIVAPLYMKEDEGDSFIKLHNIDLVRCSSEYDDVADQYYESPRRLGKLKVLERMDGMSSSEIKKRVIEKYS